MDMGGADANLQPIANIGADWWLNDSAGYSADFNNNPAAGVSNWVDLSTNWSTLGFYSSTTGQFQQDLPPPLVGSSTATTPTITSPTDSSTVVDTSPAPVTGSTTGTTPTTPSSTDSSTVVDAPAHHHTPAHQWAAFSSIPALTGGTVDLWNNLNGVKATGTQDTASLGAAKSANNAQLGDVSQTDRAANLVTQYSAGSFVNSGVGAGGVLNQADTSATLAQTLTKSHQHA